jgi:molecular chaperone IbpA
MRTNFDFAPFRRSTVGFDRLFELLENRSSLLSPDNYPPFDIEQDGDNRYRITLAVAGFRPDEIDMTTKQNLLVVSAQKFEVSDRNYVHRGIATRSFDCRFALGDYVQVRGAEMKDGLLSIELVREITEEMRPRKIEIGGSASQAIIDQRPGNDNGERRAA